MRQCDYRTLSADGAIRFGNRTFSKSYMLYQRNIGTSLIGMFNPLNYLEAEWRWVKHSWIVIFQQWLFGSLKHYRTWGDAWQY